MYHDVQDVQMGLRCQLHHDLLAVALCVRQATFHLVAVCTLFLQVVGLIVVFGDCARASLASTNFGKFVLLVGDQK